MTMTSGKLAEMLKNLTNGSSRPNTEISEKMTKLIESVRNGTYKPTACDDGPIEFVKLPDIDLRNHFDIGSYSYYDFEEGYKEVTRLWTYRYRMIPIEHLDAFRQEVKRMRLSAPGRARTHKYDTPEQRLLAHIKTFKGVYCRIYYRGPRPGLRFTDDEKNLVDQLKNGSRTNAQRKRDCLRCFATHFTAYFYRRR